MRPGLETITLESSFTELRLDCTRREAAAPEHGPAEVLQEQGKEQNN